MRVYQFRHIRADAESSQAGREAGQVSKASGARPSRPVESAAPAGTITVVSTERIQTLLEGAFPDAAEVRVIDRGGGDHLEVRVTAPAFNGLTRIDQHKLIYAALAEPWSEGTIHELRINTKGTA